MSIFDRLKSLLGGSAGTSGDANGEMISCEEALTRVHEFIDGELTGVPHSQVKAHFDICQQCYPHLHLESAFKAAVQRAAGDGKSPPELKARLLDALSEADG